MPSTKILLVDDSPTIRGMSRIFLKDFDVQIFEASNGIEALKLMQSNPMDILITDNNMPGMSGLSLVLALRAEPRLRDIYVLMLTSDESKSLTASAQKAGIFRVLLKREGGFQITRAIGDLLRLHAFKEPRSAQYRASNLTA